MEGPNKGDFAFAHSDCSTEYASEIVLTGRTTALTKSIGGHLPSGFRALLEITDGLAAAGVRVHGAEDAYPTDHPTLAALLVAWDSDDRDDFVVVVSLDGSDEAVYRIDVHDPAAKPHVMAPGFAAYVRSILKPGSDESTGRQGSTARSAPG